MYKLIKSVIILTVLNLLSVGTAFGQLSPWPDVTCYVSVSEFTKSPFPPQVGDKILLGTWNDQQIELIFEPAKKLVDSNVSYAVTPVPLYLTEDVLKPNPIRKWVAEYQDEANMMNIHQELTLVIIDKKISGRFQQIEKPVNNSKNRSAQDFFDLSCE